MPWAVAAAAVTAGAGAYQAKKGREAAAENRAMQQRGLNLTQQQFEQTRSDLRPYRDLGAEAARRLDAVHGLGGGSPDYSAFEESPGFQFRLEQGNKALERSAAARGMTLSGSQLKDLSRFNQGLASQEFGNWYNRLAGLASMGQNASVQTGQFGADAARTGAGIYGNMGATAAGGIANQTNAITNAAGGLASLAGQQSQKRPRQSGYGTPPLEQIYRAMPMGNQRVQ